MFLNRGDKMRWALIWFWLACTAAAGAGAAEQCGSLTGYGQYGPYDYRTDKHLLTVVEVNHFDANVENLKCCKSAPLGADIDYTLRAFPNHHRALLAMERLATKMKTDRPHLANYTVACYYERAVRFRPDDGIVRMLFANYLAKKGDPAEAIKHMEEVENNVGANANLHYNMGLVYADLKQYDKALEHAHLAYQLGFSLPGLRNKLQRAGKWREPAVAEVSQVQKPASDEAKAESPSTSDEPAAKP
jgi:tetratricopeptide (TPR) repeat protein